MGDYSRRIERISGLFHHAAESRQGSSTFGTPLFKAQRPVQCACGLKIHTLWLYVFSLQAGDCLIRQFPIKPFKQGDEFPHIKRLVSLRVSDQFYFKEVI